MAFQSVPNTLEATIIATQSGEACYNTFYAHKGSTVSQADADGYAELVDIWVGAHWLPLMPGDYIYERTDVRGLTAAIDVASSANANAGNGALSNTNLSNNASLAVKRRSAFTGRGARGRVYIPPPAPENMADDNHISTTFAGLIVAALDAMDTALGGVSLEQVIVHRVAAGVPLTTAVVFSVVEWVVVDRVIDSMRRRLPGRGT